MPEEILCITHNALLGMGYFIQVVMWGVTDKTYLKCNNGFQLLRYVSSFSMNTCAEDQHCGKYTESSLDRYSDYNLESTPYN